MAPQAGSLPARSATARAVRVRSRSTDHTASLSRVTAALTSSSPGASTVPESRRASMAPTVADSDAQTPSTSASSRRSWTSAHTPSAPRSRRVGRLDQLGRQQAGLGEGRVAGQLGHGLVQGPDDLG